MMMRKETMEEFFVFDVEGGFTGEIISTTEEDDVYKDNLEMLNGENILEGISASPKVGMIHYGIGS